MTKKDIEELLNELDIWWTYGRNDKNYTHYDLDEFRAIWFSNYDIKEIWLHWSNPNNGNQNDVPLEIENLEELKQLLIWFVKR